MTMILTNAAPLGHTLAETRTDPREVDVVAAMMEQFQETSRTAGIENDVQVCIDWEAVD